MGRPKSSKPEAEQYEDKRDSEGTRSREKSAAGREVGPIPKVKKPRRKAKCRISLRAYCETYLKGPERFNLDWSKDQREVIATMEEVVLSGGLYALAMPRGSGKTSLAEACAEWALLYGHRRFVVLLGSTAGAAIELLDTIKMDLETNDLLAEDFPEVCYPIRRLEGSAARANMQTVGGVRTRMEWTEDRVTLPTVKGSKASGSVIRVAGLLGRVRGMKVPTAAGEAFRPDFVIPDDPQTDDSATSPIQNHKRERILAGAVLKLAGPGKKIAAILPCTVIAPGDMADRMLDRDRHPEWQGRRMQMLYSFPDNEKLWEEYARVRKEEGQEAATVFYRANREEMDRGAQVAWPERYDPDQISGLQHAMDWRIDDPISFAAEGQNQPVDLTASTGTVELQADLVAARLDRLPRAVVHQSATRLTAGIDIQSQILYWLVTAWSEDYGGRVVDYGTWPRQNRAYFAADDARPSLEDVFKGMDRSARIYSGLKELTAELLGRTWPRDGGGDSLAVERCLVDAGWGEETPTVKEFVRRSPYVGVLTPSFGHGITAKSPPMSARRFKPQDERRGRDWFMPVRGDRHVTFDSNSWKSFLAERLGSAEGSAGCLWLPGERSYDHMLLADHFTAEKGIETEGRGRKLHEWISRPGMKENHWWDCGVLAAVAANMQGLVYSAGAAAGGSAERKPAPARPIKLSELQRLKREGRG